MPTDFNIPSFVIGFACALSCVAIYHVHSAPSHSAKLKQHEKLSSLKPSDFPNDMQIPTKTLHASDKEYRSALVSSKKQVQIASSPSSILISTVQSSLVKPRQKITDIGYYARDVEPMKKLDHKVVESYHGWYDLQCQGQHNDDGVTRFLPSPTSGWPGQDYCRMVGERDTMFFSCALAGGDNEYSEFAKYEHTHFNEDRVYLPCIGVALPTEPAATPPPGKEGLVRIAIGIPMTTRKSRIRSYWDSPLNNVVIPSLKKSLAADLNKYDVVLYAGYDDNDPVWVREARPPFVEAGLSVIFIKCACKTMVCNTNCIMKQAYEDNATYFFRSNDDTEYKSTNWIAPMIDALHAFDPPLLGVVGPLCKEGNTDILTHDFTHRTHMEIFNTYYPPVFENYFCDDWVSNVYGPNRTSVVTSVNVRHHLTRGHATSRYKFDFALYNHIVPLYLDGAQKINQFLDQKHRGKYPKFVANYTLKDL